MREIELGATRPEPSGTGSFCALSADGSGIGSEWEQAGVNLRVLTELERDSAIGTGGASGTRPCRTLRRDGSDNVFRCDHGYRGVAGEVGRVECEDVVDGRSLHQGNEACVVDRGPLNLIPREEHPPLAIRGGRFVQHDGISLDELDAALGRANALAVSAPGR